MEPTLPNHPRLQVGKKVVPSPKLKSISFKPEDFRPKPCIHRVKIRIFIISIADNENESQLI